MFLKDLSVSSQVYTENYLALLKVPQFVHLEELSFRLNWAPMWFLPFEGEQSLSLNKLGYLWNDDQALKLSFPFVQKLIL